MVQKTFTIDKNNASSLDAFKNKSKVVNQSLTAFFESYKEFNPKDFFTIYELSTLRLALIGRKDKSLPLVWLDIDSALKSKIESLNNYQQHLLKFTLTH